MSELEARREVFAEIWRDLRRAMASELGRARPRGVALPLLVAAAAGFALGRRAGGGQRRGGRVSPAAGV